MSRSEWKPDRRALLLMARRPAGPWLREHNGGLADGGTSWVKPDAQKGALFCWNLIPTWLGLGIPPCPIEERPISTRPVPFKPNLESSDLKKDKPNRRFPSESGFIWINNLIPSIFITVQTELSEIILPSKSFSSESRSSSVRRLILPADRPKGLQAKNKDWSQENLGFILPEARLHLWKVRLAALSLLINWVWCTTARGGKGEERKAMPFNGRHYQTVLDSDNYI